MDTGTAAPRRRMRADARRNYERLLAEAATAFAEYGAEFSLEEIARRAGVANGTLYGHFPSRRALLEALMGDRMRALATAGHGLLTHPSPFAGLTAWADAAMAHATVYRGLGSALMQAIEDETSELHTACEAVLAAGEGLVARARTAGEVRPEVTAADLYALINAAAWAGEQSSRQQGERLLAFGLAGLRTPSTPAPTDHGATP
ncbi:TetR/AcrR family transcriptional regulator [Plantactinospora sp. S1510]|uniref:TetR/AcrR family transcriptional regulator n=1 Tax=Plantactinospora alkalitolerans TaxID=2789879 RepID=A0ABS0GS40_9ACTN|nr:TetR/AcrR family transcriptional regulator [Plantactinospora alkalitolerans]MBF9129011.1 TetR/AcrR family transcriptional regulator [Plantactinospora alkalitolerans]